jgi:hypothetical protein
VKTSRKEIDMVKLSNPAGRNVSGKTVRTGRKKMEVAKLSEL